MNASNVCVALALALNALVMFWAQKEFVIIRLLLERLINEKEERKDRKQ